MSNAIPRNVLQHFVREALWAENPDGEIGTFLAAYGTGPTEEQAHRAVAILEEARTRLRGNPDRPAPPGGPVPPGAQGAGQPRAAAWTAAVEANVAASFRVPPAGRF